MKYISVDDLQAYCDNQIGHSITPNEFQRMNHIEIVRCKDCWKRDTYQCCVHVGGMPYSHDTDDEWFCADGERKDGDGE